jgi:GNAT superfamily N-acetyltransferase
MPLSVTTDPVEVARLADAVAEADPLGNSIFGAIARGAMQDDAAPWAAHPAHDPLTLAARSQRHTPVAFTRNWTDLADVGAELKGLEPPVVALGGADVIVSSVAETLDRVVTDRMDERLFRLDELAVPSRVSGRARPADEGDVSFLADWYADFTIEAFGRPLPGFEPRRMVERGLTVSRCWLWLDGKDDTPRAMAVRHPIVHGTAGIGPVYTPEEFRRHGYGSAVTAAAAQDVLDHDATPWLYTDLANPTSNKIYQAIGFRPVLDRTSLRFA